MERKNIRHEAWRYLRDGDFQEDDVWDVLDRHQSSSMISSHITTPSEPRMIPARQSREGTAPMRQHSAPVNVPDWSMVHRNNKKKVHDDDEEDVSPEEYFLRRSRTPPSSSSVMEGVGRKLKGRDLSRVRNAILKKTGFLE